MTTKSQPFRKPLSSRETTKARRDYPPGGWQDRLAFGYMFRVLTGLAATLLPMALLTLVGMFNGWQVSEPMLIAFGLLSAVTAFLGEAVRIGVYETRQRNYARKKGAREFDIDSVDETFLARAANPDWGYLVGKRIFDIIVSATAITLLIPACTIVVLAIKFDSPGPALFKQSRAGYRGSKISLFKFRTMYINGETKDGSRITRVGYFLQRTSINELPQLLNVLLGGMSLVGPRPPLASSTDAPLPVERALTYFAKPGITGVAAFGDEKDAHTYLIERSFLLDLKIMFRTLLVLTIRSIR